MDIKNKFLKAKQKIAFGSVALLASVGASAAVPGEVTKAITDGFADAQTVAYAILVGLAVLYGITLAKRLLR